MAILPQQEKFLFTDINRAVWDMRAELDEGANAQEYVELLQIAHEGSPPFAEFESQINRRASIIKYEHEIQRQPGVVLNIRRPVDRETIPSMYLNHDLHHGFALGLHVNRKILGRGSAAILASNVADLMASETSDIEEYANFLERTGSKVYTNALSIPGGVGLYDKDPLRTFSEELCRDIYSGDMLRALQFKVGLGIARGAFNLLTVDTNHQLLGIEEATKSL